MSLKKTYFKSLWDFNMGFSGYMGLRTKLKTAQTHISRKPHVKGGTFYMFPAKYHFLHV